MCDSMKACEMLPLNEYEHSKSRTSLAFDSCEQQQHNHHQVSDHINGRVNVTSRRMTPYSEGTLRSSEQIYFPSPYALSRVVSVYESNDNVVPQHNHHPAVTLSKTASSSSPSSSSPSHRHLSTQTPSHSISRHQKQHYDVPFKQASI